MTTRVETDRRYQTNGNSLSDSLLLVFGVVLCDMIMARCFRYAVRLVNVLLSWAGMHVSNWLTGRPHQAKPAELTAGAVFVAEQQNSHSARPIR